MESGTRTLKDAINEALRAWIGSQKTTHYCFGTAAGPHPFPKLVRMEELVARRELAAGNVQAVIDVVDSSALERNMLLTVQMLEMGIPVVLGCNMMDEARAAGIHIDMERLGELLGIPVLPMVARSGEGLDEAMAVAIRLAQEGKANALRISYGSDIDPVLLDMEKRIEDSGLLTKKYMRDYIKARLAEAAHKAAKE